MPVTACSNSLRYFCSSWHWDSSKRLCSALSSWTPLCKGLAVAGHPLPPELVFDWRSDTQPSGINKKRSPAKTRPLGNRLLKVFGIPSGGGWSAGSLDVRLPWTPRVGDGMRHQLKSLPTQEEDAEWLQDRRSSPTSRACLGPVRNCRLSLVKRG